VKVSVIRQEINMAGANAYLCVDSGQSVLVVLPVK